MTPLTWEGIVDDSDEFVYGLDRSPLGRFNGSIEVLSAVDKAHRIRNLESEGFRFAGYTFSKAKNEAYVMAAHMHEDFYAVEDDVYFWWSYVGEPMGIPRAEIVEALPSARMRYDIAEHSEMHDYFAAGLWDKDFITRCISDSIDPEIAFSVFLEGAVF